MITTAMQDLGSVGDVLKAVPGAVSAILVIFVVLVFVKFMRWITKEFLEQNAAQAKAFTEALAQHAKADEELRNEVSDMRTDLGRVLEAVRD